MEIDEFCCIFTSVAYLYIVLIFVGIKNKKIVLSIIIIIMKVFYSVLIIITVCTILSQRLFYYNTCVLYIYSIRSEYINL